jgi:hypothetical protein
MASPYNLDLTASQVNEAVNNAYDSDAQPSSGSLKLVKSGSIFTWAIGLFRKKFTVTSVAVTAYTVLADDQCLWVDDDTAGGDVDVTLLSASAGEGLPLVVDKLGTTGKVTLIGTVDGVVNLELLVQGDKITIVSDGTQYRSIA